MGIFKGLTNIFRTKSLRRHRSIDSLAFTDGRILGEIQKLLGFGQFVTDSERLVVDRVDADKVGIVNIIVD